MEDVDALQDEGNNHNNKQKMAGSSKTCGEKTGANEGSVNKARDIITAPDGGWGWMIVVAAFISNFIIDGVIGCFGLLFPDLLEQFSASSALTSMAGSMIVGVYMCSSMFMTFTPHVCLSSYLSIRLSVSVFLSVFCLLTLLVSLSVSLCYLPACQSILPWSRVCVRVFVYLCVCVCVVCVCVCMCVCVSFPFYLPIYLRYFRFDLLTCRPIHPDIKTIYPPWN